MNKKVFISYSWGDREHQQWIQNLATRLMNDTVDVVLDKWSLKAGQDIYSFMEEMVKSQDIFRVLIISNKKYTEKADEREGGVGTETQIITPNIYEKEKQEKFIPIVLEKNEIDDPFLPVYLKSRKYIDFSQIESFEDSYEELLRNILEAPSLPKPKLGTKPPEYITESIINLSETNNKLRTIENQLNKNGSISIREYKNFTDIYLDNLWSFDKQDIQANLKLDGENLINTLRSYKPLREDFIKFVDLLSAFNAQNSDEILIEFFENAPIFNRPKEDVYWSGNENRFEIFKIIFHELFIYTIAVCINNKNYELTADLLQSKYCKKDINTRGVETFSFLYNYHRCLEDYMSKTFNKISGFGEYIITNLSDKLKKQDVILADTICYFISNLNPNNIYKKWFPNTYLYGEREGLAFFEKMTSKKHFEKTKCLFNVNTEQDLKDKLNLSKNTSKDRWTYSREYREIPFIHELIDPDKISLYR